MGWDDEDLIFTALAESGLSRAAFAERVVRVPVRTVERWLNGVIPLPPDMRNHLEAFMAMSPDEREAFVYPMLERDESVS